MTKLNDFTEALTQILVDYEGDFHNEAITAIKQEIAKRMPSDDLADPKYQDKTDLLYDNGFLDCLAEIRKALQLGEKE